MASLAISAVFRWKARRSGGTIPRSAEPRALKLGRGLIGIPLFASMLAYAVHPAVIGWSHIPLPSAARWVAAGLACVMIPFTYWVFRSLGNNVSETILTKEGQALVTSGPYRWVRHPLYGTALLTFGLLSIVAASWLLFLLVAAAALGIRTVAVQEEEQLQRRFPAYAGYMSRTGRFVPRWR